MRFGFREVIFVLVLLAMPVAAYLFVFQPRNQQIADAREEMRLKQNKLRQLETGAKNVEDLKSEIDHITQSIADFERRLPAQREVEVILKEVWDIAAKQHLVPKKITTDKIETANQYSVQPINMTIAGNCDGFYKFMLELERLPRITQVWKMNLKKVNAEDGQMTADLTLKIFFDSSDGAAGRENGGGGRSGS